MNEIGELNLCCAAQNNQSTLAFHLFIKTTIFRAENKTILEYQDILDKYGDNKIANLKLKIALGVYRFNSSLTFDDLKDLGKVETVNIEGTTYYFLSEFFTMNDAEAARKKVVQRGIKDAYITFYYNDECVKIQEVVSLLQ